MTVTSGMLPDGVAVVCVGETCVIRTGLTDDLRRPALLVARSRGGVVILSDAEVVEIAGRVDRELSA